MEWTEADKAMCAKVAGEVMEKVMVSHIAGCPYGKQQAQDKKFFVGLLIGAGALGGSVAGVVQHLMGS